MSATRTTFAMVAALLTCATVAETSSVATNAITCLTREEMWNREVEEGRKKYGDSLAGRCVFASLYENKDFRNDHPTLRKADEISDAIESELAASNPGSAGFYVEFACLLGACPTKARREQWGWENAKMPFDEWRNRTDVQFHFLLRAISFCEGHGLDYDRLLAAEFLRDVNLCIDEMRRRGEGWDRHVAVLAPYAERLKPVVENLRLRFYEPMQTQYRRDLLDAGHTNSYKEAIGRINDMIAEGLGYLPPWADDVEGKASKQSDGCPKIAGGRKERMER